MRPAFFAAALLALLLGAGLDAAPKGAGGAAFSAGGAERTPLGTLRQGGELYFQVRSLAKVYGGVEHWHPASRRVVWRLGGRSLELRMGSSEARLGRRRVRLSGGVLIKDGRAYLPLSFVIGRDFASFTGRTSRFDEAAGLLTAERKSTTGGLKVYSYNDRTRVELETARGPKPRLRRKNERLYDVVLPGAVIEKEDSKKPDDGLVRSVELIQDRRRAVLRVKLAKPGLRLAMGFADGPRRLVLDVLAPAFPPKPQKPAPAPPAEAPAAQIPSPSLPSLAGGIPPPVLPPPGIQAQISSPEPPAPPKPAAAESLKGAAALPAPLAGERRGEGAVVSTAPASTLGSSDEEEAAEEADDEDAGPDEGAPAEAESLQPPPALPPGRERPVIVVDAGHGGKDSGALGPGGSMEKSVTLAVARDLADLLGREGRFKVILTRSTDVFIPLAGRSKIANDAHADLFISIHCNAARNKKMKGLEIYFLSENASDPWAAKVAELENSVIKLEAGAEKEKPAVAVLHDLERVEFINEGSALSGLMNREISHRLDVRSRGVKQAGFYVLRGTMAPSILVETGFITNADEQRRLTDSSYRGRLVDGIYAGILRYAKLKNWDY